MTGRRRAAFLGAFAVVFLLAFPQRFGAIEFDFGIGAGWLAPALLMLGLRGLAPRAAASWAFVAGLAAHALVFHWIYVATVHYGDAPVLVGVLAPIGLALYPALFFAVFGAAWSGFVAAGLASPFVAAALWVALEWARSFALTGFPWALIGYAQHQNASLLGLAPWTGVWGLSFATVLGGAAFAALVTGGGRRREPFAALLVVAVLHVAGTLDRVFDASTPTGSVRVATLQGNIDQAVKWSPAWAERTFADYEALTREAVEQGAELVLWPETAVPGSPDWSDEIALRLGALALETNATLVVGAVGAERIAAGGVRYYDSAFVVAPDGRIVDRYDKTHLVPFGEYVPLRDLLGGFVTAIARGAAATDVSPGRTPRALAIPLPSGSTLTAGVPICYELLFPNLVSRFVSDGGQLLLAITNDAWYGRTGAPYQFLVMTALRSAESRVWTARAANTGVSALIDDRGRVRMQTKLFEQTLLVADLPLRAGASFYARHGDWLPLAASVGVVALAVAGRVRRGN
jgi:apolipoprotein N-acyltransferase